MKRFTVVIMAILIVLILAVPISLYFLVFEKPIKPHPNELVLSRDEITGWAFVQSYPSEGFDIGLNPVNLGGYFEFAQNDFHNSSVEVGCNLSITVFSFSSSGSAHDYFMHSGGNQVLSGPLFADEGGRHNGTGYEGRNGTDYLIAKTIIYEYREANIVVTINFNTYGTVENPLDPNGTYYEPWMDPIAEVQMSKIHLNNIHIF